MLITNKNKLFDNGFTSNIFDYLTNLYKDREKPKKFLSWSIYIDQSMENLNDIFPGFLGSKL